MEDVKCSKCGYYGAMERGMKVPSTGETVMKIAFLGAIFGSKANKVTYYGICPTCGHHTTVPTK